MLIGFISQPPPSGWIVLLSPYGKDSNYLVLAHGSRVIGTSYVAKNIHIGK